MLIETFGAEPLDPWQYTKPDSISFDGDNAVLNVSAPVDGNVQMVLPTGLVDASALIDVGTVEPQSNMLKMLRVRTPDGDILALRINAYPAGARLEAYFDPASDAAEVLEDVAYDPIEHRWLRIAEAGGNLTFEYGPNPTSLTQLFTVATPVDLSSATVGIAAGNYTALSAEVPAAFSQFEFRCDAG